MRKIRIIRFSKTLYKKFISNHISTLQFPPKALRLNIGCSTEKRLNETGLDLEKFSTVDVHTDTGYPPFKDEVFDYVFSSHLHEHFTRLEVGSVLDEWFRVLKVGGVFEIIYPNLHMEALRFFIKPDTRALNLIFSSPITQTKFDGHKTGFSYKMLIQLMKMRGIKNIRKAHRLSFLHPIHPIGQKLLMVV